MDALSIARQLVAMSTKSGCAPDIFIVVGFLTYLFLLVAV